MLALCFSKSIHPSLTVNLTARIWGHQAGENLPSMKLHPDGKNIALKVFENRDLPRSSRAILRDGKNGKPGAGSRFDEAASFARGLRPASAAVFAAHIAVRTELDRALGRASAGSVRLQRLAARWVLYYRPSRVSPRSRMNSSRLPMIVRIRGAAVRPERLEYGLEALAGHQRLTICRL